MIHALALWIVAASIYHARVLDPAHGGRMPAGEALAIARDSIAHPLYDGEYGPLRTAAVLIIFSAHESHHTNAPPYPDSDQITRGGPFGTTAPYTAAHALADLSASRAACPANPWARYAGGCHYPAAQAISQHRQALADALLAASGIVP